MNSRRLYRNNHDRVLSGVCSGIADYFEIDPVLVRLVWIVLALSGGSGVIAYILAAIIIPCEPAYLEVNKNMQS